MVEQNFSAAGSLFSALSEHQHLTVLIPKLEQFLLVASDRIVKTNTVNLIGGRGGRGGTQAQQSQHL